jgi:hypothetical protein
MRYLGLNCAPALSPEGAKVAKAFSDLSNTIPPLPRLTPAMPYLGGKIKFKLRPKSECEKVWMTFRLEKLIAIWEYKIDQN